MDDDDEEEEAEEVRMVYRLHCIHSKVTRLFERGCIIGLFFFLFLKKVATNFKLQSIVNKGWFS